VDEACKSCERRGLVCTSADKTWGPRRAVAQADVLSSTLAFATGDPVRASDAQSANSLSPALDASTESSSAGADDCSITSVGRFIPASISEVDPLTSEHVAYLRGLDRQLLTTEIKMPRRSILFVRELGWERETRSKPIHSAFPWPEFTIVSKPFRYAALALACRTRDRAATPKMLEHMSKYFHYVQQAIEENSLVEVAAATYAILLNEYIANQGASEVTRHFGGLCAVLKSLEITKVAPRDVSLLKEFFSGALQATRLAAWATYEPEYQISVAQINKLIDLTATLQRTSPDPFESDGISELESECIERMNGLECYLLVYLDTYLALRTFLPANGHILHESCIDSIERSILEIIERLTLLIPQRRGAAQLLAWAGRGCGNSLEPYEEPLVDDWVDRFDYSDIRGALLFAWAKVIQSILWGFEAARRHYTTISAARVLYHLSLVGARKCPTGGVDISKYLFWSGLILTKDVDIAGIELL